MTDENRLVNEAINGNADAFGELIKRYTSMVYNTVHSIIGNDNEVDDIVQEVFIKVYGSIVDFEQKSSFKTWLYRITVNKCYDTIRKNKIRRTVPIEDTPLRESNISNESHYKAQELLNLLPPEERTIVTLRDVDGFSYKEMSEILKCSMANVKVRLFRARRELIKRYKKHEK